MITLADVQSGLKEVVQPFIKDNLPKQTVLLDQIKEATDVEFMNNNFYVPIRTTRHGGIANLANGSSKLVSGKSGLGRASVGVKILTGTFDIEKLVIDATKNTKGAVENQLSFQAKTLLSDFSRNVNRQLYSDGVGIVSQVNGSASSTTFTVKAPDSSLDDGRSIDNYGSVNGDIAPTKFLTPGQVIGIGTAAAAVGTISSVVATPGGGTVTLTGATASAANDAIYVLDGDGAGAGTSELTGIRAALSSSTGTSTYAGVARSVTGWSPALSTTSEALSLSRIEDVYLSANEFAQKGDKYAIFMNKTLYKKYGDILSAMRRIVDETDLLGGWKGLKFTLGQGEIGVFLDYDVPDGEVLIINLNTWERCQVSDMDWMEDPNGGAMLRRADYLTYQATMAWFMNVICTAPGANGRLTQKTV